MVAAGIHTQSFAAQLHHLGKFTEYDNYHRSHMSRDHLPPVREEPDEVAKLSIEEVEVKSYVGGLVKAFERKAA